MSDLVEVAKALVSPCEKLIEATRSAIGKAYEPRYIKRMADAKAYEIRQIQNALSDSIDVPIVYEKGELTMDTKDFDDLLKRARSRLAYQELRKQTNIEAVFGSAYLQLESENPVTSEPIDQDWLIRFFNSVEDISNEQMQYLWGKLLAGEIKQPHTFSMRTLNVFKDMTQKEADVFKRISPYILTCPGNDEKSFLDYFLPSPGLVGGDILKKYNIYFPDILLLDEVGIITATSNISVSMHLSLGEKDWIMSSQGGIECINESDKPVSLVHSAYVLTEAGKELFPIIYDENPTNISSEYVDDFINDLIRINTVKPESHIKIIKSKEQNIEKT